jgi:NADP-dependent aldehyde dehydrogenase
MSMPDAGGWLEGLGRDGRADLLTSIAAELEKAGDDIVTTADQETSLGEDRLRGELARTTHQLSFLGEVIRDGGYLEVTIDHGDGSRPDLRRMLVPIGPVAVFGASNFPLAFSVPGGDTASALAAGCPVIVKAHPAHPRTSERCAEAIRNALTDAPSGVFALVHGVEAGAALVRDPRIRAVGFTGSLAGGRALFDIAAARPDPIPFYGELGSVNPLLVTAAAAAERAADIGTGIARSVLLGQGQFCTKPGLILLPAGADQVVAALLESVASAAPGRMLTDGIRDAFLAGTATVAALPGVEVLHAAGPVVVRTRAARLLEDDAAPLREEHFGPFAVIAEYDTADDVRDVLAALPPALTGTVQSAGPDDPGLPHALALLRDRAGRIVVDGYPTGVAVTWAMHHGGPYPASTAAGETSVGAASVRRWLRPVTYQSTPQHLLPPELTDTGVPGLPRRIDGRLETVPDNERPAS